MMMNFQAYYDYLIKIGLCEICCLRYFRCRNTEYLGIEKTFKRLNIKKNEVVSPFDHQEKKLRPNPCVACLGLFEESNLEHTVLQILSNCALDEYQIDEFLTSISIPILLQLNQLQIWLDLKEKFPENEISSIIPPDQPIKDVIKIVLNDRLAKGLNKTYSQDGVMINIFYDVLNEEEQLKKLVDVAPDLFNERNQQRRRFGKEFITRTFFEKYLTPASIDPSTFKKFIPTPPAAPDSALLFNKVTIVGPTIFIAGRYCKYSRELSQTPWFIEGRRVHDYSVQEIIVDQVAPYFNIPKSGVVFSSSGREDVDVRCLGRGRPFVLELIDSRKTQLTEAAAVEMEKNVTLSKLVLVRDLQLVKREDLSAIKSGEEDKKKLYRALCILDQPATVELMEKLNMPEGFMTQQITPLRVLHRRPLLTRPRQIYSVKACVDRTNPKVVILDIVTQAGTYIKELVHGEFSRTNPSISSIIDQFIDITALDVMGIDLDWPKTIIR